MIQTPWIRRLVALMLLAAALLAVFSFLVSPLVEAHAELDTAIAESQEMLGRYQRLEQSAAPASDTAEPRPDGLQAALLPAKSDSLAAADLQSRVNEILRAAESEVASLQQIPSKPEHGLKAVTLRAQFAARQQSLIVALRALQSQQPWLFLDNINIQSRASPNPDDEKNADPDLSITMDIYGYLKDAGE